MSWIPPLSSLIKVTFNIMSPDFGPLFTQTDAQNCLPIRFYNYYIRLTFNNDSQTPPDGMQFMATSRDGK